MAEQPGLHSFFVYNNTYGPREGEEIKKVLYYYPPSADENTKCRDVGLSEAMIKFVETFTDKPCQSIHTLKQRHLYYEAEANFWIVMKLNVPYSKKRKNEDIMDEYHDETVHDNVYSSVLRQAYDMFKLFMGSFEKILENNSGDVECLKQRLEHFYSRYLITLKLSQCDILDVHNGISWLPLDKSMYLKVQVLMNRLEAKYPGIAYTAFLYSDYLVWTGVPQHEMRIIYQYLLTSLFPAHHEQEMTSSNSSKKTYSGNNYGQFITDVPDGTDSSKSKIPRVHLTTDGVTQEYHLLVYRALSITICAFVQGGTVITSEFCKSLDFDLGPTLTDLSTELTKAPQRQSVGDPVIKYIYFNHMNLATKTTVHIDTRKTRKVSIPIEIMSSIADINEDLSPYNHDCECLMKTAGDYWVVCKKSDSREIYVVIADKNANLIQINDEVHKLCSTQFANMFHID